MTQNINLTIPVIEKISSGSGSGGGATPGGDNSPIQQRDQYLVATQPDNKKGTFVNHKDGISSKSVPYMNGTSAFTFNTTEGVAVSGNTKRPSSNTQNAYEIANGENVVTAQSDLGVEKLDSSITGNFFYGFKKEDFEIDEQPISTYSIANKTFESNADIITGENDLHFFYGTNGKRYFFQNKYNRKQSSTLYYDYYLYEVDDNYNFTLINSGQLSYPQSTSSAPIFSMNKGNASIFYADNINTHGSTYCFGSYVDKTTLDVIPYTGSYSGYLAAKVSCICNNKTYVFHFDGNTPAGSTIYWNAKAYPLDFNGETGQTVGLGLRTTTNMLTLTTEGTNIKIYYTDNGNNYEAILDTTTDTITSTTIISEMPDLTTHNIVERDGFETDMVNLKTIYDGNNAAVYIIPVTYWGTQYMLSGNLCEFSFDGDKVFSISKDDPFTTSWKEIFSQGWTYETLSNQVSFFSNGAYTKNDFSQTQTTLTASIKSNLPKAYGVMQNDVSIIKY